VTKFIAKIVAWITAGYPEGVPGPDRVPLLALLKRRLTDDEKQKLADSAKVVWDSLMIIRNRKVNTPPPAPRGDADPAAGRGRSSGGVPEPGSSQAGSIQRMVAVPLSEIRMSADALNSTARGALMAALRAMTAGGALETAADVSERLQAIASFLDDYDPYFVYSPSARPAGQPAPVVPGSILARETISQEMVDRLDVIARSPEVMEHAAPGFRVLFEQTPAGEALRARLEALVIDGGDLELGDAAVIEFTHVPKLFQDELGEPMRGGVIRITPQRAPIPTRLTRVGMPDVRSAPAGGSFGCATNFRRRRAWPSSLVSSPGSPRRSPAPHAASAGRPRRRSCVRA